MRRYLKWLGLLLLAPIGFILCYLLIAFGLVLFPANAEPSNPTINAYIVSNGVHTDFVFPIESPQIDWRTIFPLAHLKAVPPDAAFMAIGWGDREFYLNTQNWGDLTVGRALSALSGQDRSLVHVEYLRAAELKAGTYRLPLSVAQYASLVNYVLETTQRAGLQGVNVPGAHYGRYDAFYEANGSYNLFNTCNAWIGHGLLQAGVKVSRWTPLDVNVLWHLQPGGPNVLEIRERN
ncbi:TIGR02117 family protein [Andreprevotia chitinilytica]|uniref:TIGR02117 family protein n=1 Tax=Andreprevotia chitinilytica TaxID=396808 RepID=UPI001B802BE9|nr:TIGR02117 family protein [Andreprevotia chitinilytica]